MKAVSEETRSRKQRGRTSRHRSIRGYNSLQRLLTFPQGARAKTNFTALGCVIGASLNNAHFKSVLQSNTLAPQPWFTPWIYASVLAGDVLGVNGPTEQWLTRYVRVFSLTFMFFPKLKKASAVTHPKGLRKVKIILKYYERKWVSGEECRILCMNWKVKDFMLHLTKIENKI